MMIYHKNKLYGLIILYKTINVIKIFENCIYTCLYVLELEGTGQMKTIGLIFQLIQNMRFVIQAYMYIV